MALVDFDTRAALVIKFDDAALGEHRHHLGIGSVDGQTCYVHAAVLLQLKPLGLRCATNIPSDKHQLPTLVKQTCRERVIII